MSDGIKTAMENFQKNADSSPSNDMSASGGPHSDAGAQGGLASVHIMVPHEKGGKHHVHAMHHGGHVESSEHESWGDAHAKAGEHLKAHHGAK